MRDILYIIEVKFCNDPRKKTQIVYNHKQILSSLESISRSVWGTDYRIGFETAAN